MACEERASLLKFKQTDLHILTGIKSSPKPCPHLPHSIHCQFHTVGIRFTLVVLSLTLLSPRGGHRCLQRRSGDSSHSDRIIAGTEPKPGPSDLSSSAHATFNIAST